MNELDAKNTLTAEELVSLQRYRRAVNYLAAAQIYLKANPLLDEPLRPEHIKDRLLSHWGTAPGINLIYAHLNRLILKTDASVLLITGPGHGAAANLANMYLEGTLTEFFPELTRDRAGLQRFVKAFSWPDAFPSHLYPGYPGVIHEGGELGYALATAFGAAFDNPDLLVACIVGDGEAETGPTAAAWHSNKFLNPQTDGAVLPILHVNGFKITNPTIFGTMSDTELRALFTGYGYAVHIVELSEHIDETMSAALCKAYGEIRDIQLRARTGVAIERPCWPMIVLRTPKGWSGPKLVDGHAVEGSFRAHQVPAKDAKSNPNHLQIVETWLRSYRAQELFEADGAPCEDILALCPPGKRRIAMNPHAFFNFHGYTAAIKQLLWERRENSRFDLNGYREEGTTTTPFDMHIHNRTSRYHLIIQGAQKIAAGNPKAAAKAEQLIVKYERKIADHGSFIKREGVDPPEIADWRWSHG